MYFVIKLRLVEGKVTVTNQYPASNLVLAGRMQEHFDKSRVDFEEEIHIVNLEET